MSDGKVEAKNMHWPLHHFCVHSHEIWPRKFSVPFVLHVKIFENWFYI